MNKHDAFDDFLAEQLRQGQDYLPDEGFTAGVISALPAPKARNRLLEYVIIGVPLLIISALVFSQFPFLTVVRTVWFWLVQVNTWDWFTVSIVASACMTVAATFWFVQAANE